MQSMTGFGRGEAKGIKGQIIVEIKTLNHRYFDLSFKLPESLSNFEDKIKERIKGAVERGKINFSLTYKKGTQQSAVVSINKPLAKKYHNMMLALKKELRLKDDIGISAILSLPEVLTYEEPKEDADKLWPYVEEALNKALSRLKRGRGVEGKALYNDLSKRIKLISGALLKIERRSPLVVENYRRTLAGRLESLLRGVDVDMDKIEMEVAMFAKNCDVTEEIVRMNSHLANFRGIMQKEGGVGKELDFFAQELNREINTIGSKANDATISHEVVRIKTEIERIREQLHNVE